MLVSLAPREVLPSWFALVPFLFLLIPVDPTVFRDAWFSKKPLVPTHVSRGFNTSFHWLQLMCHSSILSLLSWQRTCSIYASKMLQADLFISAYLSPLLHVMLFFSANWQLLRSPFFRLASPFQWPSFSFSYSSPHPEYKLLCTNPFYVLHTLRPGL